jgi:hypothetical protein
MSNSVFKTVTLALAMATLVAFCTAAAWCSQPETGQVVVKILVPQTKGAVDNFIIYPYPIRPPKSTTELKKLPKTMKQLREALFSTGYSNRISTSKPFSAMGWRWRYIFQTAVAKSRDPLPENLADAYTWVDRIIPFVIPELKKVNLAESNRVKQYDKAVEFWDLNGVELENEATRKKLGPVEITFNEKFISRGDLVPGRWWLVGTHRVAGGLIFYWQEPFTVVPGYVNNVKLDEWNALFIQGSW